MVNTNGRGGPMHRPRRRRRKNSNASASDSAGDTDTEAASSTVIDPKTRTTKEEAAVGFAERRQLQRNAAAQKRRLKMKVRCLSSMLLVRCVPTELCICSKEKEKKLTLTILIPGSLSLDWVFLLCVSLSRCFGGIFHTTTSVSSLWESGSCPSRMSGNRR